MPETIRPFGLCLNMFSTCADCMGRTKFDTYSKFVVLLEKNAPRKAICQTCPNGQPRDLTQREDVAVDAYLAEFAPVQAVA